MPPDFVKVRCCSCSIDFHIPDMLWKTLRETHSDFYCPKGHGQHYTQKSDIEVVRESLEAERKTTASLTRRVGRLEMSIRGYKGCIGRLKRKK